MINPEGLSEREILLAGQVLKEAGYDRALYTSPGRWTPQMVTDSISYMEMSGRPRSLSPQSRTILKDLRANIGWHSVRSRQLSGAPFADWTVKYNDSPHHNLPKEICAVALEVVGHTRLNISMSLTNPTTHCEIARQIEFTQRAWLSDAIGYEYLGHIEPDTQLLENCPCANCEAEREDELP
jgi:hypothetical protein